MRILKLIMHMWLGMPLAANACFCFKVESPYFLNTLGQSHSPPYVPIPENARGILFFSDIEWNDVSYSDSGEALVRNIPPAVTAAQFSILELETGRSVQPIVRRLNVDQQMGRSDEQLFYLKAHDQKVSVAGVDVTADVRKAAGLFRVEPAGGFRVGNRYQFTFRPSGSGKRSIQTEVKIGSAVALSSADNYSLRLAGPLTPQMISLPDFWRCGQKIAAVVQELNYEVPPSLEPYRSAILSFTHQRLSFGQDGKPPAFIHTRYAPTKCINALPGHSEIGALKDLTLARCVRDGERTGDLLVKGYVGILEVEDTLHETNTLVIPFKESTKEMCARLGVFDKD